MKLAAGDIVVGLDIGSTKVCVVVGELDGNGEIEVMGYGVQKCAGMKKGMIVDIEEVIRAIEDAVIDAEEMTDVDIDSVYVGIGGRSMESFTTTGTIAITDMNREITEEDKERVIEAARAINIPPNREIILVIPLSYSVDDQEEVKEPIGMNGSKLQVEAHIVTLSVTTVKNMMKVVNGSGLSIEQMIFQPLAAAEAVLTSDEKELGVAMVDIGAGTTDIAIFVDGHVRYLSTLPVGSDNITADIAVCEVVPHEEAEKLKLNYGTLNRELIDESEMIEAETASRDMNKMVSRYELHEIIAARMEEILGLVNDEIAKSELANFIPSGVVLTGGGARMDGIVEFASGILGCPVRIGRPTNLVGLSEKTSLPQYSVAMGLMSLGFRFEQSRLSKRKNHGGVVMQMLYWFRDWLKDLF